MRSPLSPARLALLEERARHMRFHPTPPEQAFWRLAAGSRLGVAFRRQVVFGRFVVDFVAPKAKLIVEIDGAQHLRTADASRDARRDRVLAVMGYRVLRIGAEMIRTDPEGVARLVTEALGVAARLRR